MLQNVDDGCTFERNGNADNVNGMTRDLDELRRNIDSQKNLLLEKETQLRQEHENVRLHDFGN